jgi:CHRD domain
MVWIATVAIGLCMTACGSETASNLMPTPSPPLTGQPFAMNPEPGVKATGTVTVFAGASTTTIEIRLSGLQANSSHVSHIHVGSCQQRGGIAFALNQVVADGQGLADTRTTLDQTYPPATGHWYAVVHAGPDMQGSNASYLLCGNLFL